MYTSAAGRRLCRGSRLCRGPPTRIRVIIIIIIIIIRVIIIIIIIISSSSSIPRPGESGSRPSTLKRSRLSGAI